MLTEADIQQFRRDGYLAVRQAIDPDTLEALRQATDDWVEKSRSVQKSTDVFDLEPDHSPSAPRLRRLNHPVALADTYWQVASSDSVLDVVAALIGPDIKFHHSKLNMKASKGGAAIGWHQDFAFFPHTNTDLVACGIALDDASRENGCLLVVPGTHRLGLLNHRDGNEQFVGQITTDGDRFDESTAAPVELRAGDMSVHHVCAVHGSTANTSGRPRRLLIYQYAACDAIQLDRRPPVNEYSERVVRGAPVTHARLEGAVTYRLRGDTRGVQSIFERQAAAR